MIKYLIGAIAGGALGYFVLYRLIGCTSGGCAITANPYISTIYGIILGLLVAGMIGLPSKYKDAEQPGDSQTSLLSESEKSEGAVYKKLTAKQAKARIDSGDELIILDVRTEAEYAAEHIEGAILIPNETIADKMPNDLPDLDAEILIYCRSGNRSAQAARKLIAIGYTNVYDFGGIIDWPYDTIKGS